MPLIEPIIRPPAEADSLLLQVTVGCSSNTCTFCGAYLDKPFRMIDRRQIAEDIEAAARRYPQTRRVFLLDGDALAMKNEHLLPVLEVLEGRFPGLTRVSSYANGFNIRSRNLDELRQLSRHHLTLIYMGLESGSQEVLHRCRKRSSVEEMVRAVGRCREAGIKSSVIVLLGLGGAELSGQHVRGTIEALNRMQPAYLSFLSLMLIPGTSLHEEAREGTFRELNPRELVGEAYEIIKGLELTRTVFRSNHASNHLPLEGRFPKDKGRLLAELEQGRKGQRWLRPEFFRGL